MIVNDSERRKGGIGGFQEHEGKIDDGSSRAILSFRKVTVPSSFFSRKRSKAIEIGVDEEPA